MTNEKIDIIYCNYNSFITLYKEKNKIDMIDKFYFEIHLIFL